MKELFNDLLESSKERIKNPFIRSFLFSWIILNWKAIVILFFSSITIIERIQLIEKTYSEIAYRLWLPLLIAILYVIILPYIMWGIEHISKLAYKKRQSILYDKKTAVIIEKQKVAKEEVKLENIKADYREKSELNQKIESLKKENEKLKNSDENNLIEIEKLKKEKTDLQTRHKNEENTLKSENEALQNQLELSTTEKEPLIKKNEELEKQIQILNKGHLNKTNKLEKENLDLHETIDELKYEKDDLKYEQSELNDDLKTLQKEIFNLKSALTKEKGANSKLDAEYEDFKRSNYFKHFEKIEHLIQEFLSLAPDIPNEVISFYEKNNIIVPDGIFSFSEFRHIFTEKGHYFWKKYLEEKNSK